MGSHLSKVIEKAFKANIDDFINATFEELQNIDEVGPIVAKTINKFWQDKTNINIVESCLAMGVKLDSNLEPISEKLMNQSYRISFGKFHSKKDVKKLFELIKKSVA